MDPLVAVSIVDPWIGVWMGRAINEFIDRLFASLSAQVVGGAGAERRHTFVLQLRITTPHYGHLILQMAAYAL